MLTALGVSGYIEMYRGRPCRGSRQKKKKEKKRKKRTFVKRTYPSQECSRRWAYPDTLKGIEAVPAEDRTWIDGVPTRRSDH
jgi:hypothetical protein